MAGQITDASDGPRYGVKTIASILDLTPRRVAQLVNEGVIPRVSHGRYTIAGAVRGYVAYLRDRANGAQSSGADTTDLHGAKLRKVAAEAEIAQLKARTLRGELVAADEVAADARGAMLEIRQRLSLIPQRIALQVVACDNERAARDLLSAELDAALSDLADIGDRTAADELDELAELEPGDDFDGDDE